MPRKINPISYRLGLLQLWNSNTTTYGNNINFTQTSKNYFLEVFIQNFLKKQGLEIGNLRWTATSSEISLIISCINFTNKIGKLTILPKKLVSVVGSLYNLPVKVYLLKNSHWFCTSEFLKSYFEFKLKNNNSLKQVLKDATQLIKTQLNSKKVVFTLCGPVSLRLTGFKIRSTGRVPNSRNQMSQSTQSSTGRIPLAELNNYVEYSQVPIFTKSGIYSLHIWLLYII